MHDLLDLLEPVLIDNVDVLLFFAGLDPSSFKLYTYWYSRFLYFIYITAYQKYQIIEKIDVQIIKYYLFSEGRRGLQPGTVKVQYSAIKHMLHPFAEKFKFLYEVNVEIKQVFRFIEKVYGRPVNKRTPVTYYILYKILEYIDFDVLIDHAKNNQEIFSRKTVKIMNFRKVNFQVR